MIYAEAITTRTRGIPICSIESVIVRQLPEGFMVNNKDAFLAWTPIGQIAKVNKDNLTVSNMDLHLDETFEFERSSRESLFLMLV
jgi:hypothetical protein